MKLSKRKLKQIIREEYSRLHRRGLLSESAVWQYNEAMGPDGQDCPEGTTIEECADGWAQYIADMDYDALYEIKHRAPMKDGWDTLKYIIRTGDHCAQLLEECMEGMDIEGSGNWNYDDAMEALFFAIKRANPRDNRND